MSYLQQGNEDLFGHYDVNSKTRESLQEPNQVNPG